MLQCLIVVQPGEFAFDQRTLALVDMTIGLGRRHQRLEDGLAVLLDLRGRQAVKGLWCGVWRRALLGLPIAISLVGQDAQGRETTIGHRLAAILASLLAAQQQAHGTGGQRTAGSAGQQTAQSARA
ncbi:hypothetical protein D3C80_1745050 [compost metagenome]